MLSSQCCKGSKYNCQRPGRHKEVMVQPPALSDSRTPFLAAAHADKFQLSPPVPRTTYI